MKYPKSIESLIEGFKSLPGIGEKTAERLALSLVDSDDEKLDKFANSIIDVKNKIKRCSICNNITDYEVCDICSDKTRDQSILCVVDDVRNIILFEKYGILNGVYHVLNGLISPINEINPEDINFDKLIKRIEEGNIKEIIIALNPTLEAETTALYINKMLEDYDVKVTKIAHGVPMGADMGYLDPMTLETSILNRKKLS
jgi:recombination protein RecR